MRNMKEGREGREGSEKRKRRINEEKIPVTPLLPQTNHNSTLQNPKHPFSTKTQPRAAYTFPNLIGGYPAHKRKKRKQRTTTKTIPSHKTLPRPPLQSQSLPHHPTPHHHTTLITITALRLRHKRNRRGTLLRRLRHRLHRGRRLSMVDRDGMLTHNSGRGRYGGRSRREGADVRGTLGA